MRRLLTACSVEIYKLRRSFVLWGTLLFILFVTTLFLGQPDWPSYFEKIAFLYASVFGLMGFGLITSWTFGREYSDRTLKDLLILPISRGNIAIAKYVAIVFWCFVMMLISFAYAVILGFVSGLPGFSFASIQHYLFLILTIGALHLLISAPLALLACISRGYLVPIGFAFTTLMLALVFGSTAIGTYLPWSVPAFHLQESGVASFPLAGISYFLVFLIGLVGFIGTVKWLQNREQR
ncbi:bacitracin ABC transporter permease [Paenibacillus lautus]|uniref:ABC transporter permease n=1 Tax=Paenibacillus lautus TaxID=1401 RepID=UPI001B11379F|nr:ABC transporter permease [Paenibacillus lautus]GIO98399.1 bacitracin ABC transporter permease [Paenibacillus lautus]